MIVTFEIAGRERGREADTVIVGRTGRHSPNSRAPRIFPVAAGSVERSPSALSRGN